MFSMFSPALEFFCGIGGFAAAIQGFNVRSVGAFDQSPAALAVYRLNFPAHAAYQTNLETVTAGELAAFRAEFWWLSPPCQPYGVRGAGRDLDDPRARSFARLLQAFAELPEEHLPARLALENVVGFARSRARERLLTLLAQRGYHFRERHLCPTELGVPCRRPRYYLAASRTPLPPLPPLSPPLQRRLTDYLDPHPDDGVPRDLLLPPAITEKFGDGLRLLDPADPSAYTTCFTAGYGKSLMHAGSYLRCGEGVRLFSPEEVARLLHFPDGFRFPEKMPARKRWQLLGNSLSVLAVREVLRVFPGLDDSGSLPRDQGLTAGSGKKIAP